MRMAKFKVEQASWPPAPGKVFIGRDTLDLLDIAVGDTVTVKPPGPGAPVQLQVTSGVYDPSLALADEEQIGRGYLSSASLAPPGQPASLDQLKIQVADEGRTQPTRDRDAIVAVAGDVSRWLKQDYGLNVREIQAPKPYKHPHQWQVDALLVTLLAGGVAALLLSAILVVNMLNTLFTQQIPQIGIMKAIGARTTSIGRLYLLMTLVVAAAATLVALPLSVLLGRIGLQRFLDLLGVDAVNLGAPWWVYVVILVAGLGLPPMLVLVPLTKASRITVREAIDHNSHGARTSAATFLVARLTRLRRLNRGLLMALRNTIRRPARFALSMGLLASAGAVFVAAMSLGAGTDAVSQNRKDQRNWDVDVQLPMPASAQQVTGLLREVPDVTMVEGMARMQVGIAGPDGIPTTKTYPEQGHGGVSLAAVAEDNKTFTLPKQLDGRWLKPGEKGAVVINQITRRDTLPDAEVGDTTELIISGKPITWRIVGLVEEREGGGGGIYTTPAGFGDAMAKTQGQSSTEPSQEQPPKDGVNMLRVATSSHDEKTRAAVVAAVEKKLNEAKVPVAFVASVSRSDAISDGHMDPVITTLVGIASAMALVGGIGLASTMSTNILDRTREFGVMHAIGAGPKAVRRIVVAEAVFLALASCVVAVVPAFILTWVLGDGLGTLFMDAPLPFKISLVGVGIWLVIVIFGAALASGAAASRASRLTVREALAHV